MIVKSLFKKEGIKGFYQGLLPTLLRAFPASAAFFAGVELSHFLYLQA